ncbi:protein zwilch-like [Teleopsis dalmanni]|uniref:protein zwilch-like n=1 Tax=Teleopsis dalmanni TaxID=139649 RepID=UPI0018CD439E|nr:protein zwilch-like [Teleopsis dalmanni]
MHCCLGNVYEFLETRYGNQYKIELGTPSTYLNKITGVGVKEKIIYCYNEERNRPNLNIISPSKINIKVGKCEVDLDLTGSPLKDECLVESFSDMSLVAKSETDNPWEHDEEVHKGINVEKVCNIICNEEFQKLMSGDAQGSVWFLCDALDAEKTLLWQYEFLANNFSRGIVTFQGIIPSCEVNTQTLLRHHYDITHQENRVETTIENTYQIKSDIELFCSWTTTAKLPTLIDLNASNDVVLTQIFRFDCCGTSTKDLLNQLNILTYIRDDIVAHKKANLSENNAEPVYRCGRGIDMQDLRDSVTQVMTEVSGIADFEQNLIESDIEEVLEKSKGRNLFDLTDKLWDILKCCSSYKELKLGFHVVFQCAARCNIMKIPTNKNRLAEIITEVANRRLAIPCLTGSEPLELLLEIGLQKLYKDYEYIFTESKLCSANILKQKNVVEKENDAFVSNIRKSLKNAVRVEAPPIARKTLLYKNVEKTKKLSIDSIGFKNSNFSENESGIHLAKLLQTHCILEHLLMIHIHLNINNSVSRDICSKLLKRPLKPFEGINDTLTDKIEIALPAHSLSEYLVGKDPYKRRITMVSCTELREVQSTFFYSMENICPPIVAENFKTEEKEFVKENTYYHWIYNKIKSRK